MIDDFIQIPLPIYKVDSGIVFKVSSFIRNHGNAKCVQQQLDIIGIFNLCNTLADVL